MLIGVTPPTDTAKVGKEVDYITFVEFIHRGGVVYVFGVNHFD